MFRLFSGKDSLDEFIENIKEYTTDSLFYKWLTDNKVTLYPENHKICMQNLAVNGLIVLENTADKKIFLKNINDDIDYAKFDFITPIDNNNSELEYSKENFVSLASKLETSNFTSFIKSLNEIILSHINFKEKY